MKLKVLSIRFQALDSQFDEVRKAFEGKCEGMNAKSELVFDSPKTWRNFMSHQKLEILTHISKERPSNVYQLAKSLGRPPQHVLKDARALEFFGFIKLEETGKNRKSLRPVLSFSYDLISVENPVGLSFPISDSALKILKESSIA